MTSPRIPFRPQESTLPWKKMMTATLLVGMTIVAIASLAVDSSNTQKAEVAYAKARDCYWNQDLDCAQESIEDAIHLKSMGHYYYFQYDILAAKDQPFLAEKALDNALQATPSNAAYQFEKAKVLYANTGALSQALPFFKKALQLDPKNSEYRLFYASSLIDTGQQKDGILALEQLAKDDAHYSDVWNSLALAYKEAGEENKALETQKRAVKLFPDSAYYWYWLGTAYDDLKQTENAISAYQKSIQLEPESGTRAAYRIAALSGKPVEQRYRIILEDTIPAEFSDNHAILTLEVNGHRGRFLLDTGASDSILFKSFLSRYNISAPVDAPKTRYNTANGIISLPVAYGKIKVGRFVLSNVRLALDVSQQNSSEIDGILGMNVLKEFNLQIDSLSKRVILSRK